MVAKIHRETLYRADRDGQRWHWTIHPSSEVAFRERGEVTFATEREAEAACRAVIDRGITHANRP